MSFHKIESYFLKNLIWNLQTGNKILIGIDLIMGGCDNINISKTMINFFHRKGFFTWNKLIASWLGPFPIWKDSTCLDLTEDLAREWMQVMNGLKSYGFC